MNRFGTRLSLALYWLMLVMTVLLLLAGLVGLMLIVVSTLRPDALVDVDVSVQGVAIEAAAPTIGVVILVMVSLASLVLWQLIGLLRSAADGAPFVVANVRRLRVIAAVLAVAAFAGPVASALLPSADGDALWQVDGGSLLGALLALVLAEVFRAGVALREDAEGTI